jgi:hypothetical protein
VQRNIDGGSTYFYIVTRAACYFAALALLTSPGGLPKVVQWNLGNRRRRVLLQDAEPITADYILCA